MQMAVVAARILLLMALLAPTHSSHRLHDKLESGAISDLPTGSVAYNVPRVVGCERTHTGYRINKGNWKK